MEYQQGTRRIEVVVRREAYGAIGGEGARIMEGGGAEMGAGAKRTWRSILLGSESKERQNRVIKTNVTHGIAILKQAAGLVLNYQMAGIGEKTGDQALQDNIQRTYEVTFDAVNIASSIAMGALYGSWGGPLGAVLGAAGAALSTGISTSVKYAGRGREFSYKVYKQENAIQYQRARAGISLTTGRLR